MTAVTVRVQYLLLICDCIHQSKHTFRFLPEKVTKLRLNTCPASSSCSCSSPLNHILLRNNLQNEVLCCLKFEALAISLCQRTQYNTAFVHGISNIYLSFPQWSMCSPRKHGWQSVAASRRSTRLVCGKIVLESAVSLMASSRGRLMADCA